MELNERLSKWDAMHRCPCGRWEYACRRGKWLWQRQVEGKFSYLFADVSACEVCEWDLRKSPAENIASLTAKDWVGTIKGSCFAVEGAAVPLLPKDVDEKALEFVGCNLDNRIIPAGVRIEGGCHRNLWAQNDGEDWVCDWVTNEPLEPVNVKGHILAGKSIDPAHIPATKAEKDPNADAKLRELAEAGKKLIAETDHVECECVAKARSAVAAALADRFPYVDTERNPQKFGKPDPLCKVCLGKGARHPALTEATVAALKTDGKFGTTAGVSG